jgi:hypothetical protein
LKILEIEKSGYYQRKYDYFVTLENKKKLRISVAYLSEYWFIHSNDFEDIDEFKIFFRESMLRCPLFYDRLRFIVSNQEKLIISCYGENKLSTVYSSIRQGD